MRFLIDECMSIDLVSIASRAERSPKAPSGVLRPAAFQKGRIA